MKYISLSLLLCSPYMFLSAMEQNDHMVTLPSKKILLEQLEPIQEYKHFINNSSFINTFAGQNKYAPEIFMCLTWDIEKHHERHKNDTETFNLEMLKPRVMTLMLQDYPDTILFLRKNNVLTAMITVPSINTLRTYLAEYDHLVSKTQIVQQLADTQKYPTEVFMIVTTQVHEYGKQLNNPIIAKTFKFLIPTITKTILQKHPDAIDFLVNEGLLHKD